MDQYIYETLIALLYVAVAYGFYSKLTKTLYKVAESKEDPELTAMMQVGRYAAFFKTALFSASIAWPATVVFLTAYSLFKKD